MKDKLYSERLGHKVIRSIFQRNELDSQTKVRIWDLLTDELLTDNIVYRSRRFKIFFKEVLYRIFSESLEEFPYKIGSVRGLMKRLLYEMEFYHLFDLLEIGIKHQSFRHTGYFVSEINKIFEEEMVAYRIINEIITPITDEKEVAELKEALESSPDNICVHLNRGLELFSDRENPDYRNSIKESISAIEAMVINVLGKRGTLGALLKKMDLHPSLKEGYIKIYGYTSDGDGIRHALMDDPNVGFAEAKYFLVSCAAFVNMLREKFGGVKTDE